MYFDTIFFATAAFLLLYIPYRIYKSCTTIKTPDTDFKKLEEIITLNINKEIQNLKDVITKEVEIKNNLDKVFITQQVEKATKEFCEDLKRKALPRDSCKSSGSFYGVDIPVYDYTGVNNISRLTIFGNRMSILATKTGANILENTKTWGSAYDFILKVERETYNMHAAIQEMNSFLSNKTNISQGDFGFFLEKLMDYYRKLIL